MSLIRLGQTITYGLVQKLIVYEARKFSRKFGLDCDDLVGEGSLVFMSAYHSYAGDKGAEFSSWLRTKLVYHYYSLLRSTRKIPKPIDTDIDMIPTEHTSYLPERPRLKTTEAEEVLIVFDKLPQNDNPYKVRANLVAALKRRGWTRTKIERAMGEVSRAYQAQE